MAFKIENNTLRLCFREALLVSLLHPSSGVCSLAHMKQRKVTLTWTSLMRFGACSEHGHSLFRSRRIAC